MRYRAALRTTGVWSIPETRARPRRTAARAESSCAAVSARDLASELENRLALNNLWRAGWGLGHILLHPLTGAARRLLRPGPLIAGRDGGQFRPVAHGVVGDEAGNAAQQLLDLLAPARHRVGERRGVAPATNHDVHRAPPEGSTRLREPHSSNFARHVKFRGARRFVLDCMRIMAANPQCRDGQASHHFRP